MLNRFFAAKTLAPVYNLATTSHNPAAPLAAVAGTEPYTAGVAWGDPEGDSRPFTSLALVYDAIMADIEYDAWGEFILTTVTARGWLGGRCLDFGCGTGNATFPLFARGF